MVEKGEKQWKSKSLGEGGEVEGCDGERWGRGVQEYECVCIFKAVFLLQEEEEEEKKTVV